MKVWMETSTTPSDSLFPLDDVHAQKFLGKGYEIGYIENQIAVAEVTGKWDEYRRWSLVYAGKLLDEGSAQRGEEFCRGLCG